MAQLIRSRSKVDISYQAGGGMLFDAVSSRMHDIFEPVLCTYIDLDVLIETCDMSDMQMRVTQMLMEGFSFEDIAEIIGCTHQTIRVHFKRAVNAIVKKNNKDWVKIHRD